MTTKLPRWMRSVDSSVAWEEYGSRDPYFGVVSDPKFQRSRLSPAALDEFFESGARHVSQIAEIVRAHFRPDFHPRLGLDHGCGVGRTTIPLAGLCRRVVGVDVAGSMLREARRNCRERRICNVDLLRSEDLLCIAPASFDFVHTYIVLQHIPPARGELLIRALIRSLADDGIGVLQFTYHRRASKVRRLLHWTRRHLPLVRNIANLANGKPFGYPLMDMHRYDVNRVLQIFQEMGCHQSYLHLTDHGGHLGLALVFAKHALSSL